MTQVAAGLQRGSEYEQLRNSYVSVTSMTGGYLGPHSHSVRFFCRSSVVLSER